MTRTATTSETRDDTIRGLLVLAQEYSSVHMDAEAETLARAADLLIRARNEADDDDGGE